MATDSKEDAQTSATTKKELVDHIVSAIEQSSIKGGSKHEIVTFLLVQPEITQEDINDAYEQYYKKHNLCEITFMVNEDNIGFVVSMDSDGRNAIVTKIENKENKSRGLQIGSRIVEINGTNIQGWKHKNIIEKIEKEKTRPLCIVFKQPGNDDDDDKSGPARVGLMNEIAKQHPDWDVDVIGQAAHIIRSQKFSDTSRIGRIYLLNELAEKNYDWTVGQIRRVASVIHSLQE